MSVMVPGDVLAVDSDNVKLGPGLLENEQGISAIKAGLLIHQKPNKYWLENIQKRVYSYFYFKYVPAAGDCIIGIITAKYSEFYKVDIGSSQQATLSVLAFEGATKRNRPNLQVWHV